MKKITLEAIRRILQTKGLPFKDSLSTILGSLIQSMHPECRVRTYPPEVVVFCMMSQALERNGSLKSAVLRNNAERARLGLEPASVNTAAFSDARQRLDGKILIAAALKVTEDADDQIDKRWKWHGFTPKAIDGTTITANDTEENQARFPQHGKQETGVGFPLMRLVAIQSLATGMIVGANYDSFQGKETGEMGLARELLPSLKTGDLLVGDRYYPSYFTMATLIQNGIEGVFQSHGARDVDFRRGESLGVLDHLVEWQRPARPGWMSKEEYRNYPRTLILRETDVTDEMKTADRFVIVSTLKDPVTYSKQELCKLYHRRWDIELALRDLKVTMGLEHIAANTPDMVEKEIWSHILAYNALRWQMVNAATIAERPVSSVSVTTSIQVLLNNTGNILGASRRDLTDLRALLFYQMLQCPVGNRPGRKEPRAVKKRPKPQRRLHEQRSQWKQKNAA